MNDRKYAGVNDEIDVEPLLLGGLRFEVILQTKKSLFRRRVSLSVDIAIVVRGHRLKFYYQELADLSNGPILAEAFHSQPADDYFLVSPELVDARSSMGESLKERRFGADSLLLLCGATILEELSATQQEELIEWLQSIPAI